MRKTLTMAVAAITLASGAMSPALALPQGFQAAITTPGEAYRVDVQNRGCYRGERPRECRERMRYERRYGRNYEYRNGRYYSNRRDNDNDAGVALAAGILGFALGAAVIGSQNDRSYYDSRRTNRTWVQSCQRRYRSFDPNSGTYLGNDGYRRYCR